MLNRKKKLQRNLKTQLKMGEVNRKTTKCKTQRSIQQDIQYLVKIFLYKNSKGKIYKNKIEEYISQD